MIKDIKKNNDSNLICKVCGSNKNIVEIKEMEKIDFYTEAGIKYEKIYICKKCILKDSSEYYFCEACGDEYAYLLSELEVVGYSIVLCPSHKIEYENNHILEDD